MIPTCTWEVYKVQITLSKTDNSAEIGILSTLWETLVGLNLDMCFGVKVELFHSQDNSLHCIRGGHQIFMRERI